MSMSTQPLEVYLDWKNLQVSPVTPIEKATKEELDWAKEVSRYLPRSLTFMDAYDLLFSSREEKRYQSLASALDDQLIRKATITVLKSNKSFEVYIDVLKRKIVGRVEI